MSLKKSASKNIAFHKMGHHHHKKGHHHHKKGAAKVYVSSDQVMDRLVSTLSTQENNAQTIDFCSYVNNVPIVNGTMSILGVLQMFNRFPHPINHPYLTTALDSLVNTRGYKVVVPYKIVALASHLKSKSSVTSTEITDLTNLIINNCNTNSTLIPFCRYMNMAIINGTPLTLAQILHRYVSHPRRYSRYIHATLAAVINTGDYYVNVPNDVNSIAKGLHSQKYVDPREIRDSLLPAIRNRCNISSNIEISTPK